MTEYIHRHTIRQRGRIKTPNRLRRIIYRAIGMHNVHDLIAVLQSLAIIVCKAFASNLQKNVVLRRKSASSVNVKCS